MSDADEEAKPVHRAKYVNANGDVSALCFKRRRAIDLKRATWTIIDANVTCPDCLRAMQGRGGGR